ncbi:MAG: DegT/DnrJ/EryC1/StrS family aminotransferase [Alphaproteobacteria bacterium]|nr:DegT/DnrJ/EryC1/StrS family aminotransferase [Alphaproteobacteria bacterium]
MLTSTTTSTTGAPTTIPIAEPWIDDSDVAEVAAAVRTSWGVNAYKYTRLFEADVAERLDRRFALSTCSGSAAIHLAMLAAEIGPGDEVIVPDATWIGSAAPVVWVGATPVFADVEAANGCLSVETIRHLVTPRTKAVVVVDLMGNLPDWDALEAFCKQRGLILIEDAAQAMGAHIEGRMAGSFGHMSIFSFAGNKTITSGEGGVLLTDDPGFYRRAATLRDHGKAPDGLPMYQTEIGQRYRMSDLQGALARAQLRRLDDIVERKREVLGVYRSVLSNVPGLRMNPGYEEDRSVFWMTTAMLEEPLVTRRAELVKRLADAGVSSRPFFYPLSSLPAFAKVPGVAEWAAANRNAHDLHHRGLCLPSGPGTDLAMIRKVAEILRNLAIEMVAE